MTGVPVGRDFLFAFRCFTLFVFALKSYGSRIAIRPFASTLRGGRITTIFLWVAE